MTDKWNKYPFAVKVKTVVSKYRITGDVTKSNLLKYNFSTMRYFTKNSHFLLLYNPAPLHI